MSRLTRRSFLSMALGTTSLIALPVSASTNAPSTTPFRHADVIERARILATKTFSHRPSVPEDWLNQSYDDYKARWFRTTDALWADTDRSYNIDFFLPGLYFPRAVQVYSVTDGHIEHQPFNINLFEAHKRAPDLSTEGNLGYSGIRLRTQFNAPDKKNEFCVFQGASYFRAIGAEHAYGLSARGLALKTGDAEGEEFPEFTDFWLEAPAPGQKNMVVHALMDSPSVSGAYRFNITPGTNCVMDVEATLFARTELPHVGLGPLTSMFLYDDTNRHLFDDFRPAVHDSEGLLVKNGNGEILWRPLANPKHLQISSFVDENPQGFGLMQRSRDLSDFADLEAHYHRRPSLWVEPLGDWGKGAVTLVEIPADKEIYDNIVAYWRPREPFAAGSEIKLSYRLTWGEEPDMVLPRVLNTASGEKIFGDPGRLMIVDFEASPLFADFVDGEEGEGILDIHISSPHVETTDGVLQRNPETGGLRLAFSFDPGEQDHIELRAQLRKDGAAASEVWLYRWTT